MRLKREELEPVTSVEMLAWLADHRRAVTVENRGALPAAVYLNMTVKTVLNFMKNNGMRIIPKGGNK